MSTNDNVDVHVRLRDKAKFKHDARDSADSIDDIGDAGDRAARKLGALSVASTNTRLNLGPFSTTMRGGVIAVGAMAIGVERLTPGLVGLAEATASVVGGGAAAGGVGLLALGQGAGVAALGLHGLSDALGGNEEAIRRLAPEARELFDMLSQERDTLQGLAQGGLLPGLTEGGQAAMRNAGVIRAIVQDTARMLGGLAREGGNMLGSPEWGRDLQTVGAANVEILDSLGGAGLHLADALRHVAVEASPLAKWLAESAESGSRMVELWARDARASGDMARFFADSRRNLELIASIGGHGGRGIINLFGAQDVDGTRTLANLDRLMARFERWTSSPAVRNGLGDAIVAEIPDAMGAASDMIARTLVEAAPKAAELFIDGFIEADAWGKLLMGGWLFRKLGGFKAAGGLLGKTGMPGTAGLTGKGGSPANPLWVAVVNGDMPGGGRGPGGVLGKAGRVGRFARGGFLSLGAVAIEEAVRRSAEEIQRQKNDGLTSDQFSRRASRQLRDRVPLSGEAPPRFRVPVDAQGFPTGPPIRLENVIKIDGEVVERHSREVLERRQARN